MYNWDQTIREHVFFNSQPFLYFVQYNEEYLCVYNVHAMYLLFVEVQLGI